MTLSGNLCQAPNRLIIPIYRIIIPVLRYIVIMAITYAKLRINVITIVIS